MKRRLVNYHEKWLSYEYIGSCYLFQSVLTETRLLSNFLQTDVLLVYEVYGAIINTKDNLDIIINEESEDLPFKVIFTNKKANECHVEVSAASKKGEKVATDRGRPLTEAEYVEGRININVGKTETFTLNNVRQGQAKLKELRSDLFDKIKGCLDQRFEEKEEVAMITAAKVLDSQDWADAYDADMRMGDRKSLLLIHTKFQNVLSDVDIDECYKEWPKIKQFVRRNYGHLAKRQHCVWTKFLNKQGTHYPNCSQLIKIILVILSSPSDIERGFYTTKLQLTDRRSHMNNTLLDGIFRIKINLPMLGKEYNQIELKVVEDAVKLYQSKKKWRCQPKPAKVMKTVEVASLTDSEDFQTDVNNESDDCLSDCYTESNEESDHEEIDYYLEMANYGETEEERPRDNDESNASGENHSSDSRDSD